MPPTHARMQRGACVREPNTRPTYAYQRLSWYVTQHTELFRTHLPVYELPTHNPLAAFAYTYVESTMGRNAGTKWGIRTTPAYTPQFEEDTPYCKMENKENMQELPQTATPQSAHRLGKICTFTPICSELSPFCIQNGVSMQHFFCWQTQQNGESAILTYAAVSPQFAFLNGELCSPVYVYWKKGKRKQCHQPQYTLTARAQWLWEAHTRYKAHKTYHETVSLCEKQSRGKQICNGLAQHRIYDLRHWNETATRPQAHIPSGANPHQGQGSVESDPRGVIVLRIYRFQKVGQTITRDTLQRPKLK